MRIELPDDGVSASLGLVLRPFESCALVAVWARGPVNLVVRDSLPRLIVLYSPLSFGRTWWTSPLIFISDVDDGVIVCRPDRAARASFASIAAALDEGATCSEADSARLPSRMGVFCSYWLWEKKLALDAVIGVVGVLVFPRDIGGVARPAAAAAAAPVVRSWSAATLATVGVLSGKRLSGGSRRGWRFRRLAAGVAVTAVSPSDGRRGKDMARLACSSRSARAALVARTAAVRASSVVLVSVLESMGRLDFRVMK